MRDWTRDNPIADAEDYSNRTHPAIGTCECCNMPIYEGLSYIDLGDVLLHNENECILDYIRQFKVMG